MKTNKITKIIIAIMAVVILSSLTATAFADTGSNLLPEGTAYKKDGRGHGKHQNGERFEDWFEDRIDSRERSTDFSQLPNNPSDEEMIEFFQKYFTGQEPTGESGKNGKQGRCSKNRAEWFEDWFEKRIESRSRYVDFSQLPENPSDEEMIEFFRKNFTGDSNRKEPQDQAPEMGSEAFGKAPDQKPETAEPVTDITVTTETPAEQDVTVTPPAEEQPAEGTKDIA